MTGQIFFSSVPDGVFNLLSSFLKLEEFGRLHQVLQANKQCNAHWEGNLRQYAPHCTMQQTMVTSLWCGTCVSRGLTSTRGIVWRDTTVLGSRRESPLCGAVPTVLQRVEVMG